MIEMLFSLPMPSELKIINQEQDNGNDNKAQRHKRYPGRMTMVCDRQKDGSDENQKQAENACLGVDKTRPTATSDVEYSHGTRFWVQRLRSGASVLASRLQRVVGR